MYMFVRLSVKLPVCVHKLRLEGHSAKRHKNRWVRTVRSLKKKKGGVGEGVKKYPVFYASLAFMSSNF